MTPDPRTLRSTTSTAHLREFGPPHDWTEIDRATNDPGAVIVRRIVEPGTIPRLNDDVDRWLASHPEAGGPTSGSETYDGFLGRRTVRLHGLATKFPAIVPLLDDGPITQWATRMLAPVASSILLNAGELIQIGPGEATQYRHRDSDSWPLPVGERPLVVNAIVALDRFTADNGATYVAPDSHRWDPHRRPVSADLARALLEPGDAVLFRGDLLHGGGGNANGARRRGLSLSFCAGWLRPVEAGTLNVPAPAAAALPPAVSARLGYASYDGTAHLGGMLGLFENGDPVLALTQRRNRPDAAQR